MNTKRNKKHRIQKISVIFLVVMLLLLPGCGSSSEHAADSAAVETESYASDDFYSAQMNGEMAEEVVTEDAVAEEAGTGDTGKVQDNRKLIKTVDLNVETTEFDSLIAKLTNKVDSLGGYIENSEVYGGGIYDDNIREANYTVRIPSDKLDQFVEAVGESANVTRKSENVDDVTLQYVDTQSRKESLEVEQERLMALLEQADSIETIIALESRLSEVRYELENMESQLRTYDNLVDYSTVHIYISEVQIYTPEKPDTVWDRISSGFMGSIRGVADDMVDFFVGFIILLPYLFVWAAFNGVIVLIIVAIVKRSKRKKARKEQEAQKNDTTDDNVMKDEEADIN